MYEERLIDPHDDKQLPAKFAEAYEESMECLTGGSSEGAGSDSGSDCWSYQSFRSDTIADSVMRVDLLKTTIRKLYRLCKGLE